MQWDGVYVRVLIFFAPLTIQAGSHILQFYHSRHCLLLFQRGNWLWFGKMLHKIICNSSVTPSDKEEDICNAWSPPRSVYVPPLLPLRLPQHTCGTAHHHAVLQDTAEEETLEPEEPVEEGRPSSAHLLRLRLRAFMKKLLTVESSRPSCWEMVTCSSLVGRWFSLKMAMSVRRCRSVNTSRVRFGPWLRSSLLCSCSLRLQAAGTWMGDVLEGGRKRGSRLANRLAG